MARMLVERLSWVLIVGLCASCGEDPAPAEQSKAAQQEEEQNAFHIPEFYVGGKVAQPKLTIVATSADGVNKPNDLAFHPHAERAFELWVLNEDTPHTGGSTVTLFDAGSDAQDPLWLRDGNAWHFMSMPTSMAFGDNGNWASGCGVQDANHGAGTFAGPSLWSSDFDIYAAVGDPPTAQVNGSHLDMLHGSPFSMGIAHEVDNAYWVFDGYHGHIVRYDFQEPHYPGGHDHDDGLVHRYKEVEIERHAALPSHMVVDKDNGWLYVNDTGNNRILRLNIYSGEKLGDLALLNEILEEHWEMHEAVWEVFASDLDEPTGIALNEGRLFVSNHGTNHIIAFDVASGEELARISILPGVRGITVGPDNKLWLADYGQSRIVRVDP